MFLHKSEFPGRDAFTLASLKDWPAQLSCLGSSVGRASAWYAVCCKFESLLKQLIFLQKKELPLGVVAFLCLVPMTDGSCVSAVDVPPPPTRCC